MRYSHSRIETFNSCPRKFKFNYIEKLEVEVTTGIEAFLGSMVHEALEKLYKDLKFKKLNTLEEILEYYDNHWNENYKENEINIVRKEYSANNYKQMGVEFITNYYNKYKPFDQGKTIGIELQVDLNFYDANKDKTYTLIGYIDRLTMIDETYFEIHDYKTNNRTKTQNELDKDKQLALYAIAIKEMYPSVTKVDLVWHFLESGLEMRSNRSDIELEQLKEDVINNINIIENSMELDQFEAKASALCNWCEYKHLCPLKAHEIKVNSLDKNKFEEDSGVQLVDKYIELTNKKKELTKDIDNDIEQLKQAIIVYSKKNNLEKLIGSDNKIAVKCYDSLKLPSKDTDNRKKLEEFIKNNNLWDMFSDISIIQLSNMLKSGMFNKEFLDNLFKYIKKEKIYRLYSSKK